MHAQENDVMAFNMTSYWKLFPSKGCLFAHLGSCKIHLLTLNETLIYFPIFYYKGFFSEKITCELGNLQLCRFLWYVCCISFPKLKAEKLNRYY